MFSRCLKNETEKKIQFKINSFTPVMCDVSMFKCDDICLFMCVCVHNVRLECTTAQLNDRTIGARVCPRTWKSKQKSFSVIVNEMVG